MFPLYQSTNGRNRKMLSSPPLQVGTSRWIKLLARYKKDPDNFSIQYNRKTINRKIDKAIKTNIIKELNKEKVLILDKEVPIRCYNYIYV